MRFVPRAVSNGVGRILIVILWLWTGWPCGAQSYVGASAWVAEGQDTYLSSWSPTLAPEQETQLMVRSQGVSYALLHFPRYASAVDLWLNSKTNEQPIVLVAYALLAPWPLTASWSNYTPAKGARLDAVSLFAAQRWYRLELTPQTQDVLLEIQAGGAVAVYFASGEANPAYRPRFDEALPPAEPTVDPAILPPNFRVVNHDVKVWSLAL
jgi:hypothetical protein